MSGLLSPLQSEHRRKAMDLFFSPEAKNLRMDSILGGETQELAMLDHLFQGWRNLSDKGIDERSGKPIKKMGLEVDTPVQMSELEKLQTELNEVNNAIKMTGNDGEIYRSLSPDDREYVKGLIIKHIGGTDLGGIGSLGSEGRHYPQDYENQELAGTRIPANFAPGQRQSNGIARLLDVAEGMDSDSGAGLYGLPIDVMHKISAAERPDLIADPNNLKYGPQSMNQSDGRRSGDKLLDSRKQRSQNKYAEVFEAENGVPLKQRGTPLGDVNDKGTIELLKEQGRQDLAERRLVSKMNQEQLRAELSQRLLAQRVDELLASGTSPTMTKSAGEVNTSDRGKSVNIYADKVIMEKGINGNGKNGKH